MMRDTLQLVGLLMLAAAAVVTTPAAAEPVPGNDPPAAGASDDGGTDGTAGSFSLQGQITSTRVDKRPEADKVGGFQIGVLAGVQLRGTASGQGGLAIAYFKRSTAAVGLELEASFMRGPNGQVYMGILSLIMQSGARSSRMVPYLAFGGGMFRAEEKLRPAVAEALPDFGIEPVPGTETGALFAYGFGIRYYLATKVSFRIDYRDIKAITSAGLFSMRRIGGFLSFEF